MCHGLQWMVRGCLPFSLQYWYFMSRFFSGKRGFQSRKGAREKWTHIRTRPKWQWRNPLFDCKTRKLGKNRHFSFRFAAMIIYLSCHLRGMWVRLFVSWSIQKLVWNPYSWAVIRDSLPEILIQTWFGCVFRHPRKLECYKAITNSTVLPRFLDGWRELFGPSKGKNHSCLCHRLETILGITFRSVFS